MKQTIQEVIFALANLRGDAFEYGDKPLWDFARKASSELEELCSEYPEYDVTFILGS